jgi:hypothetical protein
VQNVEFMMGNVEQGMKMAGVCDKCTAIACLLQQHTLRSSALLPESLLLLHMFYLPDICSLTRKDKCTAIACLLQECEERLFPESLPLLHMFYLPDICNARIGVCRTWNS